MNYSHRAVDWMFSKSIFFLKFTSMKTKVLMSYDEPTDEQLNDLLSNIGVDTKKRAELAKVRMQEKIALEIKEAKLRWGRI